MVKNKTVFISNKREKEEKLLQSKDTYCIRKEKIMKKIDWSRRPNKTEEILRNLWYL